MNKSIAVLTLAVTTLGLAGGCSVKVPWGAKCVRGHKAYNGREWVASGGCAKWECKRGYIRSGDGCEKAKCKPGYRWDGISCKSKCKPGYRWSVYTCKPKLSKAAQRRAARAAKMRASKTLKCDTTMCRDSDLQREAKAGRLHGVEIANLKKSQVSDVGMRLLAGITNLKRLDLSGSKYVTAAGMRHLAGLKKLRYLGLSFTRITDAGLRHLAGMNELVTLYLVYARVTDAGLRQLAGLKKLRRLSLWKTQVTHAEAVRFKRAHPLCEVRANCVRTYGYIGRNGYYKGRAGLKGPVQCRCLGGSCVISLNPYIPKRKTTTPPADSP